MKTRSALVLFCLLSGLLAACSLPTATTPAPPTQIPQPSANHIPGPPVMITQIRMLDASSGWGWTAQESATRLLRTGDGGQTWADVSPANGNPANGFFLDMQNAWVPYYDPTNSKTGLLRTRDGGQTWENLPPIESLDNARYEFSTPLDGIAETAGVGAGNLYLTLYETHDGGQSWAPILITAPNAESSLPAGTVHLCGICGDSLYYDPARVLIAHGDLASEPQGVVRLALSGDLGQHWQELNLPLPDAKYASGATAPHTPVFFGQVGLLPVNIIQYNQDGGLSFSVLSIYRTQDGGQTWNSTAGILENQTSYYEMPQILSEQLAFVRCGRNLCSTKDGAQTWQMLPESLNFDSAVGGPDYVAQYQFIDAGHGWAISGESGATSLWQSLDGGITWTKLAPELAQ